MPARSHRRYPLRSHRLESGFCYFGKQSPGYSEFRVFLVVATRFMHRVLCGVDTHLVGGRGCEVYIELVSKSDEIKQHVGQLLAYLRPLLKRQRGGFRFRHPLEVLEQLGSFHTERHREVLGGMELVPIARSGELPELITQMFDWILAT